MLVHSVFFWLEPTLTAEQIAEFNRAINTLTKIPSVKMGYVGKPSSTRRPVVDRTYSYALTVVFDDIIGHDAYQVHPDHKSFIEKFNPYLCKVIIYDAE